MADLFFPLLLGTAREDRESEHVARFLLAQVEAYPGISSQLFDTSTMDLNWDEGPGLAARNPTWASAMAAADGLIIVCPEYNHGYPGSLKMALDMLLKEYIHKPVGLVGVSGGSFAGARGIENLLPVVRELGLVATFTDLNVGKVQDAFSDDGTPTDPKIIGRTEGFLQELLWMGQALKAARDK